jgi:multiple sugar transport system substrate-binding protein
MQEEYSMKKMLKSVSFVILLALAVALVPGHTFAQEVTCESDVVVQADDWLSKIADKVFGDVLAFPAIVDATNAMAATDDSYATIADPNVIEPGWKLCIPAGGEATAMMEVSSGTDWFVEAAKPYAGVAIRGISESTPPSNYAKDVLAPAFEKETGIKVEFETTSWDQMYAKPIQDMQANTGIYDFIYIEQDIIYTYLAQNFLTDLTQLLAENPQLNAPTFDQAKFTSFIDNFKDANGDIYGVPMEAFVKIMLYRKDLFEDPAIQAAFEAEYGYPLAPATTHQQYRDIADFFTKYGADNGLELWGTTVQGNTGHASSFYEFFETIAPSFGLYNWGISEVAPGNYKACVANGGSMNSDTAKEALQFWVDLLPDAPPEATSSTWDEVAATFAAGRAAEGWVYGENAAWIATDATRSQVVGNVGVALPPVSEGVMDAAKAGTGYIGYYDGGAFGIPYSSKNKEATLLWLEYIGQESVQAKWATAGSRVVMDSTFDDPLVKAQDARTDNYYTLMRRDGPLFKGAPPFPFHPQAQTTAQTYIWQALTGESTPSDALDQACVAVEEQLTQLGYSK